MLYFKLNHSQIIMFLSSVVFLWAVWWLGLLGRFGGRVGNVMLQCCRGLQAIDTYHQVDRMLICHPSVFKKILYHISVYIDYYDRATTIVREPSTTYVMRNFTFLDPTLFFFTLSDTLRYPITIIASQKQTFHK